MHRLGGQLDGLAVDRRGDDRHLHRLLGDPDGRLGGELDARGEAPGAVLDDPYGVTEGVGVDGTFQRGVGEAQGLPADALQPEVGVLGAQVPGALQGRVRQPAHRQGEEVGVDLAHVNDPSPVILSLPDKVVTPG